MNLEEKIFEAGVVGAGGAGFPTYVKAKSNVEYVLANGAECEPLIHKDYELMVNFPEEIVHGMELMMKSVNSRKGYFGIKEKNVKAIDAIGKYLGNNNIEMCLLGDFYPSGDEYELVYAATKKLIPPHGLPLDVGCVVNNVETLFNISQAEKKIPVTHKFLSVTGAVKKPSSFFAPLGISFRELIEFVGGTTVKDYSLFVSGILMGKFTNDLSEVVTKTHAGLIVLPNEHYLVKRMSRSVKDMNRIGKSACDQCSYCTEFCPRYLLGYDVQPHKVMRSLVFSTSGTAVWNQFADLCCSCGLCSLYSCPEDLYPREACDQSKREMKTNNIRYHQEREVKVHPIKEGRRVPLKQLRIRLDIEDYEKKTPFFDNKPKTNSVKLLLKQHIGNPAKAIVKLGAQIKAGDKIADCETGKLGASLHSPIEGEIKQITEEYIQIIS
ncbi:MAG: 4Fe-4S dicluster domain-containing protein [bacterium]